MHKVLPCLEGGRAQTVSDPLFPHFVAPTPPVINDQSLNASTYNQVAEGPFSQREKKAYPLYTMPVLMSAYASDTYCLH